MGPVEDHQLITTGMTSMAERQISLWDMRKMEQSEDASALTATW